jgi:hypothetical protein
VISPLAVRRIDALFEIERAINGQSAGRRKAVRQELGAPLVAKLETWTREQGESDHLRYFEIVGAEPAWSRCTRRSSGSKRGK